MGRWGLRDFVAQFDQGDPIMVGCTAIADDKNSSSEYPGEKCR